MIKENINQLNSDLLKSNNKSNCDEKNIYDDQEILDKSFSDKISERLSEIKSVFKRERLGFLYCVLAQFFWTSNDVYLKFITQYYHEKFKNKTYLFSRGLFIATLSYFLGKHFDGKIYTLSELSPEIRKCVLVRANLSFFGMSLWLVAVYYLRITTCQIISTLNPIILIYFGVIFLNEKYYHRYAVGALMGIVGSCIIVLNENKISKQAKKSDNSNNSNKSFVLIGLLSIIGNIIITGIVWVVNKIMANQKISLYTQLFYFGLFHVGYSILWMLFTKDFDYTFLYFLICGSQAFLFYLGN
jgi:drug/metabolite transporter (DMT)-like permease